MEKVADGDVKALLNTDEEDFSAFINWAHFLAEPLDLPVEQRQEIEKWLAAHAYKCKDKEVKKKTEGDSSETYAVEVKTGLKATTHGQQALALDTTGELEKEAGGTEVKFKHTG